MSAAATSERRRIRVLIADDALESRHLLSSLVSDDPALEVMASVADGAAAVRFEARPPPDVVLMDLAMPGLDGFEATRQIMEATPVPIVICSDAHDSDEVGAAFRAIEAGALSCVRKPRAGGGDDDATRARLVEMLKLMSEVKVVRRWPRARRDAAQSAARTRHGGADGEIQLVGIGASTGGPPVIQSILGALPKGFPLPVLVVQHIAKGFLAGLADWLSQTSGFRVVVASHGARPLAGHVYLAPDDFHMGLAREGHIFLSREAPVNGVRPSVSFLLRTLAEACGPSAAGVLLSGMGKDGAAELKLMRDAGAITVVQDAASCVVNGMPGEAVAQRAAMHVLAPDRIAELLAAIARRREAR
jgi:two-component system chemotaxis response regulator CheB